MELNLDDPEEVDSFIKTYGTVKGRSLANRLGLSGKHSTRVATSLSGYAWNKKVAVYCRKQGKIEEALNYERICDYIYKEDIQPFCECW